MPAVRIFSRLVLASVLAVAGCGGEGSAERQGIKVGFFGALTGPTATFAKSGKNGALLAVAEINARGRRARKAARPALRGRPRRGLRGGVGRLQAHHARPRGRPDRRERILAHARRGADRPELQGPDGLALLDEHRGHEERRLHLPRLFHRSLPGAGPRDVRAPGLESADRGDPGRRPQRLLRRPRRGLPQSLRNGRREGHRRAQVHRRRHRLLGAADFAPPAKARRPRRARLLHGRRPDRAAGEGPRALGDAPRRRRLGLPQARRDRGRGGRGLVSVEPLFGGRSLAGGARASWTRTRRSTEPSPTPSRP